MTYFQIVAATDLNETGDAAIKAAASLAHALSAQLAVAHVVEPLPHGERSFTGYPLTTEEMEREKKFSEVRTELERRFGGETRDVDTVWVARAGRPRDAIPEIAESLHADLIVVGTHGHRGIARVVLGSVAEQVVRHAATSVLVHRAGRPEPYRKVLVATDLSEAGNRAVAAAAALAAEVQAKLSVLHVVEAPVAPFAQVLAPATYVQAAEHAQTVLLGLVAGDLADKTQMVVRSVVGVARDTILETAAAEDADLIVLGAHGHRAPVRFLLGSVAEGIVRRAPTSVLVVRQTQ